METSRKDGELESEHLVRLSTAYWSRSEFTRPGDNRRIRVAFGVRTKNWTGTS